MRALIILLALVVGACGQKKVVTAPPVIVTKVEVVEKLVPTPVIRVVPPALLEPILIALPPFVSPSDPNASSALTPQGERDWLAIIDRLLTRIEALKAHATAKD